MRNETRKKNRGRLPPIKRLLRLHNLPHLHKIHQHHIRHPPMLPPTQIRLRPDTPIPARRIRPRRMHAVRHLDAQDLNVKHVVHDVHAAVRGGAGGSVDAAVWEGGVCFAEGGFEEVGEFVEDVGGCGCVGAVVWL